jgi:large subunit ribosomal protein L18
MGHILTSFEKRRQRVRTTLRATGKGKLRLSIHRTSQHIYAQVIDDKSGATVAAASTAEKALRASTGASVSAASEVGKLVAERAKAKGVSAVVFDRGGFLFHGRVKALAEAARAGGLEF